MAEIPNLAGIATKDLVEHIGTGSYKASYINWARTFNLLHQHAPGWYLEMQPDPNGELVWRAPGNGGYLMLRFRHLDGTELAPVPQSIMDNRNGPIAFEKITSRDVTDTHRRGGCMAAAMLFGLGHELWAKMPLESGYRGTEGESEDSDKQAVAPAPSKGVEPAQVAKEVTSRDFMEAGLAMGLSTFAVDALIDKLGGNFAGGIRTLALKDEAWVSQQNALHKTQEEPSSPKATKAVAKKTAAKPSPDEY